MRLNTGSWIFPFNRVHASFEALGIDAAFFQKRRFFFIPVIRLLDRDHSACQPDRRAYHPLPIFYGNAVRLALTPEPSPTQKLPSAATRFPPVTATFFATADPPSMPMALTATLSVPNPLLCSK